MNVSDLTIFIPTRGSQERIIKTAKAFAGVRELVFIHSFVAPPPGLDCTFVPGGTLPEKRNLAVELAAERGLKHCLMVDDDLGGPLAQIALAIAVLHQEWPMLGSVSALPDRQIKMRQTPFPISHPFVLRNFPCIFFSVDVEKYQSVGGATLCPYEDTEIGCKLNGIGAVCGAYTDLGYNHLRPRYGGSKAGGLPISERDATTERSLAMIRGLPSVLRVNCKRDERGELHKAVYFNWDMIMRGFLSSGGGERYKDTKRSMNK